VTAFERCEWWQVDVSPRARWWFVRLETPEGEVGCAECSDGGPEAEMERALAMLAFEIDLGDGSADGTTVLRAWRARRDAAADPRERHLFATIAGAIECALDDIATQRDGVPLWHRHAPVASTEVVQLYANINRGVRDRTPQGFARAATLALADGFTTIKCAPFDDDPPPGVTLGHAGLERVSAIRDAIGARAELLVDAHERLPLPALVALLPELESLAIAWLEDAVIFSDIDGLQRLKHATGIPLAGGEQALSLDEIAPTIRAGVLDIVIPDVKHAGMTATLAIARYASGAGLRVSLHNPTGPVATAASLHAIAATPNPGLLEFAYDALPERSRMTDPPERLDAATFRIPTGPGLGVHLVPPNQETRA
jgi:galactonate dehydratase